MAKKLRNLANYKAMHSDKARDMGVEKELAQAPTLTYARKLLYGPRKNQRPVRKMT